MKGKKEAETLKCTQKVTAMQTEDRRNSASFVLLPSVRKGILVSFIKSAKNVTDSILDSLKRLETCNKTKIAIKHGSDVKAERETSKKFTKA